METIRFSLLAKEDLALGSGTFQVTLADGRTVNLTKIDLGSIPLVSPNGTKYYLSVDDNGAITPVSAP